MKKNNTIYVGLDVHKDTIEVCWMRNDSQAEETRRIPNEARPIGKLFRVLKAEGTVKVCYEAGPCGYEVRRQLEGMGIECKVIAPALIPRRPGDRIKTDKRDARKLARLFRAGELTPIHVPTEQEEAVRDLLRCREDLSEQLTAQRHWLLKFVMRHGRMWRESKNWTQKHWVWLRAQRFDQPAAQRTFEEYLAQVDFNIERLRELDKEIAQIAETEPWKGQVAKLRCLRGIDILTAMTLIAEIQDFNRFRSPRELMAFVGLVPTTHASGGNTHHGAITKAGNAHVRRVLVEAAWNCSRPASTMANFRKRAEGQPEQVVKHALKAQQRLHSRYWRLVNRGKRPPVAAVAVAREMVGFVWALMVKFDAIATNASKPTAPARGRTMAKAA